MHRFTWNPLYPIRRGRGGRAVEEVQMRRAHRLTPGGTAWVAPGDYVVRLSVNGQTLTQSFRSRWIRGENS